MNSKLDDTAHLQGASLSVNKGRSANSKKGLKTRALPVISFVTNIVPHYRLSFYQKLANSDHYRFHLIRGFSQIGDGRPDVPHTIGILESHVKNKEWNIGPITVRWQAGVLNELRQLNPDVLILLGISGTISNWLAAYWAKRNGVPIVIWACGWEPQAHRPLIRKLKNILARHYFGLATYILTYSTKGKLYLEDLGVSAERIDVCYNGLDITPLLDKEVMIRSAAAELRSKYADEAKVIFLFVGAMLPGKQLDLLLRAYSKVEEINPTCKLWIVGDGPERTKIEAMAKDLRLQTVRFFGRIVDGVDVYFAAADYFVLPGLGGLAFNQAMFWGTPCIGSEADGTEDDLVIENETGMRFVSDNQASLTSALLACTVLNKETRRSWSTKCQFLIRDRSNVDRMVSTFKTLIDRVMTQRHLPRSGR